MTAEDAVIKAIETLVAGGQRAYVHNVPEAATGIYHQSAGGRISEYEAEKAVIAAIKTLAQKEKINAPSEQWKDWTVNN